MYYESWVVRCALVECNNNSGCEVFVVDSRIARTIIQSHKDAATKARIITCMHRFENDCTEHRQLNNEVEEGREQRNAWLMSGGKKSLTTAVQVVSGPTRNRTYEVQMHSIISARFVRFVLQLSLICLENRFIYYNCPYSVKKTVHIISHRLPIYPFTYGDRRHEL